MQRQTKINSGALSLIEIGVGVDVRFYGASKLTNKSSHFFFFPFWFLIVTINSFIVFPRFIRFSLFQFIIRFKLFCSTSLLKALSFLLFLSFGGRRERRSFPLNDHLNQDFCRL